MSIDVTSAARLVKAMHGRQDLPSDPDYQLALANELKQSYGPGGLIELYARFTTGDGFVDSANHSAAYVLLPVRVRVEWRGSTGRRTLDLNTIVCLR